MMQIIKTTLPANSILNMAGQKYDYIDSYMASVTDKENQITLIDVIKAFFPSEPSWVNWLFTLRNRIVLVFGLKTSNDVIDRQLLIDNFKCEVGERVGLFQVFARTDKEVVMGEDDKHLDFRVSLLLDGNTGDKSKKDLTISTTVVFHNWLGRLYFVPVGPFHRLIVPAMLRGVVKELQSSK